MFFGSDDDAPPPLEPEGSAFDSFLTGASGLVSLATGGMTPIYGEPEGITWGDRFEVLTGADTASAIDSEATGGAVAMTAHDVATRPGHVLKRGGDVAGEGLDSLSAALGLPPWAWKAAIGVAAAGTLAVGYLYVRPFLPPIPSPWRKANVSR